MEGPTRKPSVMNKSQGNKVRRSRRKIERDNERLMKFLIMKRSQGEDIQLDLTKMYMDINSLKSDASFRLVLKVRQLWQYGAKMLVESHVKKEKLKVLKINYLENQSNIEFSDDRGKQFEEGYFTYEVIFKMPTEEEYCKVKLNELKYGWTNPQYPSKLLDIYYDNT